jgi:hypothetical protein
MGSEYRIIFFNIRKKFFLVGLSFAIPARAEITIGKRLTGFSRLFNSDYASGNNYISDSFISRFGPNRSRLIPGVT